VIHWNAFLEGVRTKHVHLTSACPLPGRPAIAIPLCWQRARTVLGLFTRQATITAPDIARVLGIAQRTARDLATAWVTAGWLEIADAARKSRRYRLSAEYRQFVGGISAEQ